MTEFQIKDKDTYHFWLEHPIKDSDIKRFTTEKIKWNRGKLKMSRSEINKLVAFQYACFDKGLSSKVYAIEREVAKKLKKGKIK